MKKRELYALFFLFIIRINIRQTIIAAGKAMEQSSPFAILSFEPETKPTIDGPTVQPKSPARAKLANIVVEAFGISFAAIENAPGHIGATAIPQIAQPTSETIALPEREASRYAPMQATAPIIKIFVISVLSSIRE